MTQVKTIMKKSALALILFSLFLSCSNHEVDTVEEWCELISGVDLGKKYKPFWAVVSIVSLNRDAVRDNYVEIINNDLLDIVDNRAEIMAYSKDTDLHIVNPSYLVIHPSFDIGEVFISEWRNGIERIKQGNFENKVIKYPLLFPQNIKDSCFFWIAYSKFDQVKIHNFEWDQLKLDIVEDNVTEIETERPEILKQTGITKQYSF